MVDVICTPVPDTSAPVISAPEADTPAAKHGSRMTADKTTAVIFLPDRSILLPPFVFFNIIILKPTSFIKPL
jgi:hypothetical protein